MAAGNKTLGRFNLTGIPSAPRGVPQIEVTFDIDANGIVHVSAKDMGTGNVQKITITASTNLNDDEIDKAVKEAEQYADADKKQKEAIEVRNNADSLIYQTEKTIKDLGDKVSPEDKTKLEDGIASVKQALESNDNDMIKTATEKLTNDSYEVFGKAYQQAGPEAGAGPDMGGAGADGGPTQEDVVDADYEVVDDDENK